ncbi:class II fumarate hydratase [Mucilaginibacter psychrotolerans]|uniref:Fumarate hydratase class II n=1 Tax=Mucilaginibacter psychrotolerans TaxID=1524096 RepID=A0A4Y8SIQ4_9SPHI|nr:class II fumarate hydratase [Mucilaginibacter psychrotolerans]TFF38530.1 class II fumarate hydratase [Mucilaginibacter psychrotolerans]
MSTLTINIPDTEPYFRTEHDSMGAVQVPAEKYWGAQTERSRNNFKIGPKASMPAEIIEAFAYLKKAAAYANTELDVLPADKRDLIAMVCDEILAGKLPDEFPLVIWQTGSGTQSNMNVNEVIANRAHVLHGGVLGDSKTVIHPNDDVNKSQSSNDTFPTAMHVAAYKMLIYVTIPGIEALRDTLKAKSEAFKNVVKIGRTHLMDATPLTLGQEISGYVSQLDHGLRALTNTLDHLSELALGGSAVGTGMNTPEGYDVKVAEYIARFTNLPFRTADNKFEALSAHDAMVESHGALKQIAVSLMMIANNIRMLASGPRCSIGELHLPENEPGSSIMPGKINPTQNEAVTMVAAQVMGNDVSISIAGSNGQFQLNVFKPVMAASFLQSARLIGEACTSFNEHCAMGIEPNYDGIKKHLEASLMLVTALNPHIGYENSARIAQKAMKENLSLRESAIGLKLMTSKQFDEWVKPANMVGTL